MHAMSAVGEAYSNIVAKDLEGYRLGGGGLLW
jgi:hypothetical protein